MHRQGLIKSFTPREWQHQSAWAYCGEFSQHSDSFTIKTSEAERRAMMTPPSPGLKKTWVLILLACYVDVHCFQTPKRPTGGESELKKSAEKWLRRQRQRGRLIRRRQVREAEKGSVRELCFKDITAESFSTLSKYTTTENVMCSWMKTSLTKATCNYRGCLTNY